MTIIDINNNNNKIVSKYIIKDLLSYIVENENEALIKKRSIKEFVLSESFFHNTFTDYFQKVSFVKLKIIDYCLVCHEWMDIIVSTWCTQYYTHLNGPLYSFDYTPKQQMYSSFPEYNDLKKLEMMEIKRINNDLSKQYSLFNFKSIKHLFLKHNILYNLHEINLGIALDSNGTKVILDMIGRFPQLETINIETESSRLVSDILMEFPHIKVQVLIHRDYCYMSRYQDPIDLAGLNLLNLEFVHLFAKELSVAKPYGYNYSEYIKKWKADSLYYCYDAGEKDYIQHQSHSDLFNVPSLKHIFISSVDHIDLVELRLVATSKHIETFVSKSPFGIIDYDMDEYEDDSDKCNCCHDIGFFSDMYANNTHQHLEDFINDLSNNTSLKKLHLDNDCDEMHTLKIESVIKISKLLYSALLTNHILEDLSLPCDILDESFYQSFYNNQHQYNQSITTLKFSNFTMHHLKLLSKMLAHNQSITDLDLSDYGLNYGLEDQYTQDEINSQDIQLDFVNTLKYHNKTVKRIILSSNKYTNQLITMMQENVNSNITILFQKKVMISLTR